MTETQEWQGPSARERRRILGATKSVAIVGASNNPARPSYFVATYLLSATRFKVNFINPRLDTLFGQQVYPSLADLPEHQRRDHDHHLPKDLVSVAVEADPCEVKPDDHRHHTHEPAQGELEIRRKLAAQQHSPDATYQNSNRIKDGSGHQQRTLKHGGRQKEKQILIAIRRGNGQLIRPVRDVA